MPPQRSASKYLANNVAALMAANKLSQAEIARRAKMPPTTLSRVLKELEVGLSPRLETIECLARGLGVSVAELLAGVPKELPAQSESPSALARQVSRLVEDFLLASPEGRKELLAIAAEKAK